jgi:hypothetical protein
MLNLNAIFNLTTGFKANPLFVVRSGLPYTPIVGFDTQNDANDLNDRPLVNGTVAGRNSMPQPAFSALDSAPCQGLYSGPRPTNLTSSAHHPVHGAAGRLLVIRRAIILSPLLFSALRLCPTHIASLRRPSSTQEACGSVRSMIDEELRSSNGSRIQFGCSNALVVGWTRNRAHENCGSFGQRKMGNKPNTRTDVSPEPRFGCCRVPSQAIFVKEDRGDQ